MPAAIWLPCPKRSMSATNNTFAAIAQAQNRVFFRGGQDAALTRRQAGAASVASGLPAESNT
jgi:hypothetical protein